jgi:hypothetical protein
MARPYRKEIFRTSCLFFHDAEVPGDPGPPHFRGFAISLDTPHSVRFLCTSDQPHVETSDDTLHSQDTDIHALRWEYNRQSQQASGRRPTP